MAGNPEVGQWQSTKYPELKPQKRNRADALSSLGDWRHLLPCSYEVEMAKGGGGKELRVLGHMPGH